MRFHFSSSKHSRKNTSLGGSCIQHGAIDEVSRQLACKTGIGWTLALDCYKFMILGVEASIIVILLNSWSLIYYYLTNIVNNVIDFELS